MLTDAHKAGIHTYVAIAPVFPEVGYSGMLNIFKAVKEANPHTIFVEPVNIRLGIAERIHRKAMEMNIEMDMAPYRDRDTWIKYAVDTLKQAEKTANETQQIDRLHLWPDKALSSKRALKIQTMLPDAYLGWIQTYWNRISEWPGKTTNGCV